MTRQRRWWGAICGVVVAMLAAAIPVGTAQAASTASGPAYMDLTSGHLTVGSVGFGELHGTVNETVQGTYPSAVWSDTTGLGAGWQGSMAISHAIYTGGWSPEGGAPDLGAGHGGYTGNYDGVQVVVSVQSDSGSSVSFTWVDNLGHSGSGIDTPGQPCNVEDGLAVNFDPNIAYGQGDRYDLDAGAQPSSAVQLLPSVGSVVPSAETNSPPPQLINAGAIVQAGTGNNYGTPVPFVSAALQQGMGSYTVSPGVQVAVDSSAWSATYIAQAEYTIAMGPGT